MPVFRSVLKDACQISREMLYSGGSRFSEMFDEMQEYFFFLYFCCSFKKVLNVSSTSQNFV